jgi:ATP-dependent helicase HrpB
VIARDETQFRDLVLEERISSNPPAEEAARILAREVAAGRCALPNWNEAVEQWILRANRLREWMPDLGLPAIGEEERAAMRELICHGTLSADEIKARPVLPAVKSWLSRQQQAAVEDYAPERLGLPNGRTVKVVYAVDGPPTIAARIQDLYGIKEALWVASRRVPVRIQVLAPNNRPVQITDNLSVFWRETYPKLKQELQRRYPKHVWR